MYSLSTIGYAHRDTQDALDQFTAQGGTVLDIRLGTYTKVPGYQMQELKARYGARYLWVPNLGNVNHHTERDIELKQEERGLFLLSRELVRTPICIMCGCKWVETCHRLYVANRAQEENPGLEPVHLLQNGHEGMIKHARSIPLGKCAYMVDGALCPFEGEQNCEECHKPLCDMHAHAVEGFFTERAYPYCPVCYTQHLNAQARY